MSKTTVPARAGTLVPFQFETQTVRVIEIDGEPWFVAKDVMAILELSNPTETVRGLDEDEFTTTELTDSLGRNQQTYIVSEPGLYSLIVRSRKPQAKPFRRWVTHDVIPQIRKTGGYGQVQQLTGPALYLAAIEQATAEIAALEARNRALTPKAEAFDGFLGAKGDYSLNEGAKLLARNGVKDIGQNRLRDHLLRWGWLYRGRKGRLRAAQAAIECGRMSERTSWYYDKQTGEKKAGENQAAITAKGLFDVKKRLAADTGLLVVEGAA